MSEERSRRQLSPNELRFSPHTTYYTNFFVLRVAVTINGQQFEIGFSEDKGLTLNCRYPGIEYMSIDFHSISFQVEAVLKKYGVSHISNFWVGEVLYLQVGFFSEHSLKKFLWSRQEMQKELSCPLSAQLKERQLSTVSTSSARYEFPVEVKTELFLLLPDAENKIRKVFLENCSSCLILWKESEKFDIESLFRTFELRAREATEKGELSVNVLVSELSDVVDWFHFGLYLGVPTTALLRIEREYRFTMECLSHMLDWWVKNEEPAWSTVVSALLGIRMRGLAQKLAVKYAVPCTTTPIQITAKESQAVPMCVHLPSNIQQMYISFGERDEEMTEINELLPVMKKRKIAASMEHAKVEEQLTIAQDSRKRLLAERDATESQLRVEEEELVFLKQLLVEKQKENKKLQATIAKKKEKIAQLKRQLACKDSELSQTREEVQRLKEQLHQIELERVQKSTRIEEMEKAQIGLYMERRRADKMISLFCATSQRLQSPVTPIDYEEEDERPLETKKRAQSDLSSLSYNYLRKPAGLCGLANTGNKSFMNSVLQCLSNTEDLRHYLMKGIGDKLSHTDDTLRLATCFSILLNNMWMWKPLVNDIIIHHKTFTRAVESIEPRFMDSSQQDSQEFLTFILKRLHEDLKEEKAEQNDSPPRIISEASASEENPSEQAWRKSIEGNSSFIIDLFQGQLESLLTCSECNNSQPTYNHFMFLTVPLPDESEPNQNLQHCLQLLTAENPSEEWSWSCPECMKEVEPRRKICLSRLPKILIVYLKRFRTTTYGRRKVYIDTPIDFPMTLDISEFVSDNIIGQCRQYDLYAVINHHSAFGIGRVHHTAYAKHDEKWFLFDDENVKESAELIKRGAYILFYKQSDPVFPLQSRKSTRKVLSKMRTL